MRRRDVLIAGSASVLPASVFANHPPIDVLATYEAASGGRIGLYAEHSRTGAHLAWRADERVVMCSTFKASLAACVLERVDRAQDALEASIGFGTACLQDWHAPVARAALANHAAGRLSVAEMCRAVVEQSDNTCANLLLARIGGPAVMTAFWRRLGDTVTRLDDPEPMLNRTPPGGLRNTTTPAAMARTLLRLTLDADVLSVASQSTFTGWLVGCQTGANRLRAGLPGHWVIGDKTGNNGADAAGDIAVVWPSPAAPIVICASTRGGSPTPAQIEAVFAGIGRAVAQRLG